MSYEKPNCNYGTQPNAIDLKVMQTISTQQKNSALALIVARFQAVRYVSSKPQLYLLDF